MTTQAAETAPRTYDPVSVSPLSFWAGTWEDREKAFRTLRDERPVSWHPPLEGALMPPENDGVWAVTRHEHIAEVSKNPEIYSSARGVMVEEIPDDILEAASSFLAMDAPRHFQLRRLVSSAFTPKQVARIHDQIRRQASAIVDGLLTTKEGDFVGQVSKRLPMWTIYEMMGLPEDQRELAAHHADGLVSWADEDVAAGREPGEVLNEALVTLLQIGLEHTERRRAEPKADLWTSLVQAEVDGRRLTDDEIAAFFVLLSVAGNDTTRNTISVTTRALQDFPAQKALLLEDFPGRIAPAVEEFVRYVTPVQTFRRTATRDTVLGGQEIKEGDWVLMMYASGNRDERAFKDPHVMDILRPSNNHLAFGGGGPHYCMGNFLAKMQLTEIFDQLLRRAPTLRVDEPVYLAGNFVRAVKSMPYTL
ncbi:cytochrome P450 [Streptomyces mirabilis]|uniref:cytochrome P450 n=1 Tax=Streptomyces mirabilis TaxID=68239 RepID=UPI0033349D55